MSGPVSSYLLRPRRDLATACRDIKAARAEPPHCRPCPVADTCDTANARKRTKASCLPEAVARRGGDSPREA